MDFLDYNLISIRELSLVEKTQHRQKIILESDSDECEKFHGTDVYTAGETLPKQRCKQTAKLLEKSLLSGLV